MPSLKPLLAILPLLLALPAWAQDIEQRQEAAATVTRDFLQTLSGTLQRELANGPPEAVSVCTVVAPQLAGELSRQNGWQVTRVGTRVRNPMLGLPDAWESEVLDRFAERAAAGEDLATMSFGEVVTTNGRQEYRFMKAIGVQPACLTCHGAEQQIPRSVQDVLGENYPHDQATGYSIGELRGAVSIRQPMDE